MVVSLPGDIIKYVSMAILSNYIYLHALSSVECRGSLMLASEYVCPIPVQRKTFPCIGG